jgi:hypothetical protein
MQQIHTLYMYYNSKWEIVESPQTMLVSELLDKSGYFYLIVEDLNGLHALSRPHLDNSLRTNTLQVAVDLLVFNSKINSHHMSVSKITDILNVTLKNGLVLIPNVNPLVFNTTTSFITKPFNGGSYVEDYLDNVEATNDISLGAFDNLVGFQVMSLNDITTEEFESSLLKINNTLVKTSDYFKCLGNDVVVKPYKAEALMALLVEARLSHRDIGLLDGFKRDVFKSRLVCANLVKHPDVLVLVNPTKVPIELRKHVLSKSINMSTTSIVFVGNKPTTLKALALTVPKEHRAESINEQGLQLGTDETSVYQLSQVTVCYPVLS